MLSYINWTLCGTAGSRVRLPGCLVWSWAWGNICVEFHTVSLCWVSLPKMHVATVDWPHHIASRCEWAPHKVLHPIQGSSRPCYQYSHNRLQIYYDQHLTYNKCIKNLVVKFIVSGDTTPQICPLSMLLNVKHILFIKRPAAALFNCVVACDSCDRTVIVESCWCIHTRMRRSSDQSKWLNHS